MSINVTVNGNRFNIRRGRMVLSDLDQIKKNERDRRRRLRLEQVRQQSKEISDRLLERTKNIAKEEFKKLEDNSKLKEIYNGRIMEVQQKYQEDMADIGQAHLSAALEPNYDVLIEERERRNKSTATKRGQDAVKQAKEAQQTKTLQQQQHQERLRQVRELENLRSTMIAHLSKKSVPEANTICISVQNEIDEEVRQQDAYKKTKRLSTKKSPVKISKAKPKTKTIEINREDNLILEEESVPQLTEESVLQATEKSVLQSTEKSVPQSTDKSVLQPTNKSVLQPTNKSVLQPTNKSVLQSIEKSVPKSMEESSRTEPVDEIPRKERMESSSIPSKMDKSARYNPEDYVQTSSDTTYSDSSSSFSDDSSYFSDSGEQFREINQPRYVKCPGVDKVQLYDHNRHQKNLYDQPVGVVEKIQTWTEPSATDLAQELERAQTTESHLSESRKQNAQKRGEDAVLREKVRRDYQMLLQNLDQLATEERKLKASQAANYPKDVYMQEERRRLLRDQHKQKLNRAMKTLLDGECSIPCSTRPMERQITLAPIERDKKRTDIQAAWEDSCCSSQRTARRDFEEARAQSKRKENETSREVQILEMLKKVERQKRLLLQEFGADLPNDIFNASMRPLFEKDKSVQTQPTDAPDARVCRSPEIKVIDASLEERNKKDKKTKNKEKADPSTKRKEIAVQTTTGEEIVQDKGTQVELIEEKETSSTEDRRVRHHPLEPEVIIIRPGADSASTSSDTLREVPDFEKESPKATPKRKKYSVKTARQTPSKMSQKSIRKVVPKSPAKKPSKSKSPTPKKTPSKEDVPSKRIKMYVDKNGVNIKVKPPEVAEILVDVSTQCAQEIAVGTEKLGRVAETKQQWTHSKSFKMKDVSDTSTSFASPPPIRPRDILEALSNNISILEMLDSSANESLKRLRRDVSPVSTPETPSPRTMRMPSNIPHPERIKRLFQYSSAESQTNDYRQTTTSPPKSDTSTESSNDVSEQIPNVYSKGPVTLEFCLCHNPDCRQVHARFEEIRSYALKNCPQILQKYEDLQNTCAERIISLTNLIEKVRNEQKGMEFSVIDPSDDTSLMQLPPPQIATNDLETVHRLVENIEAIHNQLARTLIESQRIIKTKTPVEGNEEIKETERGTSTEGKVEDKAKPKVVRVEKVDIPMERFKRLAPSVMTSTLEQDDKPSEEEVIERLSKEILEQSKGLDSNLITSKDICTSTVNLSIQTSTDNIIRIDNSKERAVRDSDKEAKGTKDFVPLLQDIPKVVSRLADNSAHVNGRSKPPVSLLSGPYRTEIDSSGHELSTIIEFDTPDTVNRSLGNVRSPLSARKVTETQMKKSTAIVKPSGHITPSRSDKLKDPTIAKLSQEIKEPSIFFDSPTTSKNVESQDLNKEKELEDKILQCDAVDRGSMRTEECKDKDKITSTSSNSFSELSGVSQIASTPSSTLLRYASSPEEMETALKKLGLGWAITTLKKTREASALSSSSNSDTPINTAKRILSPVKKQLENNYGLLDFSDVSSISIKEASKSTEQAVLLKGRTSTPKLQNSNSESNSSNTNNSENFQVPEEGLIIPNVSLTKTKSNVKNLENL